MAARTVDWVIMRCTHLLGGECVRLTQGRYEDKTVYEPDPGVAAARFVAHPIKRLHMVDLDGAKAGKPVNTDAIVKIVKAAGEVPQGAQRSQGHAGDDRRVTRMHRRDDRSLPM